MREHFSIRFAHKIVPSVSQQFSERFVILDDPVVNDGNASMSPYVGVCIDIAWGSVSGPTRVADANGPQWGVLSDLTFEIDDFALLFFNPKHTPLLNCSDARAVVAAVFKAL